MAWAGLFLLLGWPIVAMALAARSQGGGVPARSWTLLNVLIGSSGWAALCFSATVGIETPLRLALFGLGLTLPTIISQSLVGIALFRNPNFAFSKRWSKREFSRLFGAQAVMLTTPPGLALAMVGFGMYAYSAHLALSQMIPVFVAIGVLIWLWGLVWSSLKQMMIPGQIVVFPNAAWNTELFALAERMGAKLRTCFLAQTTARKTAGAYCLGGGRVGITDSFLSALDLNEFLAVMAHEVRHLRHGIETMRVLLLGMTLTLGTGMIAMTLGGRLEEGLAALMAISLMLLAAAASARLLLKLKRRHEDEADEAAVAFVGAQPLMNALAKAYYLNSVKDLGKGSARYRSPVNRLERIAHLGNLPKEEAARTLGRIFESMKEDDAMTLARRAS